MSDDLIATLVKGLTETQSPRHADPEKPLKTQSPPQRLRKTKQKGICQQQIVRTQLYCPPGLSLTKPYPVPIQAYQAR